MARWLFWYCAFWAFVILLGFGMSLVGDALAGENQRDVDRSGRWLRRVADVEHHLRGTGVICLAWLLAIGLLSAAGLDDLPTSENRPVLGGALFVLSVLWAATAMLHVWVKSVHAERIDFVAGRQVKE